MTEWSITAGRLTPAQISGVLALAEAAQAADGVAPLSEHTLLHLRYDGSRPGPGPDSERDLILTVNDEIAGYAHLDATTNAAGTDLSGELAIHPGHRREGLGLALVRALTAEADGHPVRLWAHGDRPAAARLARAAGFDRFRALWQMRRSLRAELDQPRLPPGITLRTFRRGQDEDDWLSLNGRAFAKHPEQGAWTRHDLELREQEPWFDPAGFFIAERDGAMAGFHWTKVHGPADAPPGIGEVYVVGVDPGERGTGLGRALTLAGLHYLQERGLAEVMLYVDEDNVPAIRLYEALGFTRWRTDAMYRAPSGGTIPPRPPLLLLPGGTHPPGPPLGGKPFPPDPLGPPFGGRGLAVADAQRLVEFRRGQRPVGGRDRAQDLGVELDLIESDAIVNTKVQLPGNRAHLRRG